MDIVSMGQGEYHPIQCFLNVLAAAIVIEQADDADAYNRIYAWTYFIKIDMNDVILAHIYQHLVHDIIGDGYVLYKVMRVISSRCACREVPRAGQGHCLPLLLRIRSCPKFLEP